MAKNQLIIGLGGVGGRSIAAFRKAIVQHEADYNKLIGNGYRFEYLYIDSNINDRLGADDWEIYGRSVKLNPADSVSLKGEKSNFSIRTISKYENISPWIGELRSSFAERSGKSNIDDEALDSEIFNLDGAGQLRRYGRVLFAINSQKVRENLQNKLEKLFVGEIEAEVDVRIFCTLGGGTGSGAIVDMVTLIQNLAVGNHKYNTFLYPFIAGGLRDAQNTGSFYQNEYATLRDLNALMVEKYHPYVAASMGQDRGNNYFYSNGKRPINSIYISSEESPGSPTLSQQIEFMAKACFDTIMYGNSYKSSDCLRALSGEDLVQVNPGEPTKEDLRRSYRFAALGAKRLCVPTEQIKELLRADYAKRVMESWLNGTPLLPNTTRDLSKAVIHFNPRTGKTWEAIEYWSSSVKGRLDSEHDSIMQQEKRDVHTIERMKEEAFQVCLDAKKLMTSSEMMSQIEKKSEEDAAEILQLVQKQMDERMKWSSGGGEAWGLNDVLNFINEYMSQIGQWLHAYTGDSDEEELEQLSKRLVNNMERREEQWAKLGFLTIHLTEKDERMIKNHYEDCCSLADIALLEFKRYAIKRLIEETHKRMRDYRSLVDLAVKENKQQTAAIDQEINKINGDLSDNSQSQSLCDQYEFDNDNLQKVRQKIASMKKEHHNNMAATFSPAWTESIGTLAKFRSNMTKKLMEDISVHLYNCSEKIHEEATEGDGGLEGVLLSSIFDRLLQIAGPTPGPNNENWDKALGGIIKNFVQKFRSSSYVSGRGLTDPQTSPCKALVFGFPKDAESHPEFKKWLKEKLDSSLPDEFRPMVGRTDFYEHEAAGEIRVLYMPYWFPARFAPVVGSIYKKYQDSVKDANDAVKIYFANIDDDDIGLQSKKRPALTEEGEPDLETERLVDLAARLKIVSDGSEFPVLSMTEKEIKILKGVENGMAEYTEAYSVEERNYPSRMFKKDLGVGMSLAKDIMDEAQKQEVLNQYQTAYKNLLANGAAAASKEMDEAKKMYNFVKKRLGI